jgi:hypothetical protein
MNVIVSVIVLLTASIGFWVYGGRLESASTELASIKNGVMTLGCLAILLGLMILNELWDKKK